MLHQLCHMKTLTLILAACVTIAPRGATAQEQARWQEHARTVTIIRDDWGIAHVYGVTDADAGFGILLPHSGSITDTAR